MNKLEILMADHCTETEAKRYLATGTEIYTEGDLVQMVQNEMTDDRGYDDDSRKEYLDMIQTHIAVSDWSIVEYNGQYYYISYVL